MQNDNALAAALMARIELHFARQSEIAEATTARLEQSLKDALKLQAGCAEMAKTLDRIEAKALSPKTDM